MKRAFTLIELLVVIAIIAILAAIVFPVFSQAKMAAKKTSSTSNMKQVGLSGAMYLGDYDDMIFPLSWFNPADQSIPSTRGFHYYSVLLQPYVKNLDLFLCPADRADEPSVMGSSRFDKTSPNYMYIFGVTVSYGFNHAYLNRSEIGPMGRVFYGKSATSLENPAGTIMFGESTMKDQTVPPQPAFGIPGGLVRQPIGWARIDPASTWTGIYPNGRAYGQLWPRFSKDKVLIAWLDGHTKITGIKSLRGEGATTEEIDRYYNGLAN